MRKFAFYAFIVLAASASAQSRSSGSIVGVINAVNGGGITALAQQDSPTGATTSVTTSASFTGMNSAGDTQTMTFSGTATNNAQYGQLHSYTTGKLVNSYYNADNTVYANGGGGVVDPNGSPDNLCSLGFATFNDTLQYGGLAGSGYKARYIFHVDGTNSGVGALADLGIDVDNDQHDLLFVTQDGYSSQDWATKDFDIDGTNPQNLHVQFSTQVVFDARILDEGGTYNGTSDFSSTATLSGIEVRDASGNLVTGWTVTSGSGTVYPVPEPASLATLTCGLLALRRRRR